MFPATRLHGTLAEPRQQCTAVLAYLTLAVGVVLPVCALVSMERRDRRQAAAAAAAELPWDQQQQEVKRWCSALLPRITATDVYVASCLCFHAACIGSSFFV